MFIQNTNRTISETAQYALVDPLNPYIPPVSGLFHEQIVNTKAFSGQYTVYIPSNFQPHSGSVMILTPDGMTSKEFYNTAVGKQWKTLADKQGTAIIIVEPQGGKTWNLTDTTNARDDKAFLKKVFDTISSKSNMLLAAFNFNERAFYMVGYEEGGTAAHEVAMAWPFIFCGVATIGGSAVPLEVMTKLGEAYSYPFPESGLLDCQIEIRFQNKDIPVPMWIVESPEVSKNRSEVVTYWVAANHAIPEAQNNYAQRVYGNKSARVWLTDSASDEKVTPDILYTQFLSRVQRFSGNPGGRLDWTVDHVNNGKTGFFTSETIIDGITRRFMTYVPSTYREGTNVPLVITIHGFTSTMMLFTGDTRWWEVAEKNGFIVIFAQAYPSDDILGNIPVPYWYSHLQAKVMGLLPKNPPDDVAYFKKVIEMTKEQYSIDEFCVYASGHSNGSCMVWMLISDVPELFTAVAPIGGDYGTNYDMLHSNLSPIPIWIMKGGYDIDFGPYTERAIDYWTTYNNTSKIPQVSKDVTGRYLTKDYYNANGVPLFRSTIVTDSPHAYLPEQADMIWKDFFCKFTLNEDGTRSYNGYKIMS